MGCSSATHTNAHERAQKKSMTSSNYYTGSNITSLEKIVDFKISKKSSISKFEKISKKSSISKFRKNLEKIVDFKILKNYNDDLGKSSHAPARTRISRATPTRANDVIENGDVIENAESEQKGNSLETKSEQEIPSKSTLVGGKKV